MTAKPLTISASQLSTWTDCRRKWWLEKVVKLPQVPRGYLTFGTVLHACLERWCSADETGRGPDGAPLDVFPPGWETVEGEKVTPNEAALIRRLVEQAVERGLVTRGDGAVLEREVRLPVIENVDLVGYIDHFLRARPDGFADGALGSIAEDGYPPRIDDYKSFGESSTRFLKQKDPASPNYLGADQQLKTYAAATSIMDGWDGPVTVRHVQFPKFRDERGPRDVEATIPADTWRAHWAWIQEQAAGMLRVREVKKWDDVAGPDSPDTCGKYGGCPFRDICGRRSTLDGYRARVERQIAAPGAPRPNVSTEPRRGPKDMTDNIFARARGSKPAATIQAPPGAIPHTAATTATAPQAPAPTPAAPAVSINGGAPPAPPAAPAAAINAPPWANPLCTACHGVGFNSKGRPCPICDALAKRMKRPTSSMYVIEGDAQSGFTAAVRAENAATLAELSAPAGWSSKADALQFKSSTAAGGGAAPRATTAAEQSAVVVPPAAVQPTVQKAQEAAPTAPAGLVAPATAATVTPPATPTTGTACTVEVLVEPAEVSAKRGRKPAGMTILIGCAQLKGPDRPTESAQALLHRLGAELAKDMGGESYWALDPFKRRDRIKQRAPEIAESLGRTVLLVAGVRDPDVDSLVSSLLPHAEVVVEGLR